ncbi:MAG: cytochrome c [Candidatus Acidiferrales bacterium]
MKSRLDSGGLWSARASRRLRSAACVAAMLAAGALGGCRLDMHLQPRYNPYDPSDFFSDGRSARQPVAGTVARGELRIDEQLYTGKVDGKLADTFPFPITANDILRGQQRYNIYCSPCHDYTGSGRGMIVQRGFPPPPSYHIDRLRQAPVGHFFDVMTNGFGAMYSYASRISPEDRWRIAAYIRALQLSEHAKIEDVPDAERPKLEEKQP